MTSAIFSGESILSGRGVTNGRGVFAEPAHPLAGYSAPLMLHRGDNLPVGVYQDRACTVPATADMDPIRGWKDEILHTPLAAIAPTDANRAFLRIIGGTPCVYFDGVESRLEITGYPTGSWDSTHLLTARPVRFVTNQYLATNKHGNDRDSFIGWFGNEHVRYWNGGVPPIGCGLMDTAGFRVYAGVREDLMTGAIYRGYRDGTPGETVEVANRSQSGAEWILGAAELGVTPAEMYVSSWCLRAAKSSEEEIAAVSAYLKSLAPANPLAGTPSLLDLRTHTGDKIPLGIYPGEDDRNIWWGGFKGAGVQPVEAKQPLTKFATDGTPYLDFDGVDDWMSVGTHGGKATYTILVRSKHEGFYSVDYSSFCDLVDGDPFDRWGLIEANGLQMHFNPSPTSVRFNGQTLSQPTATFPENPSDWNVITIETHPASEAGVERGICRGANFLSAQIIALFLHEGNPSLEQVEAVENHFMTLKPDPLAGVQLNLRLQTHRGDRIPLGLYQDVACTIPATADGDLVAAWRDEFTGSGLVAVQNISSHRPKLRFEEGVPQLEFDGVDDVLLLGDHFQEITDCVAVIGFKPQSSPSGENGAGTALWQFGTMHDGSYWTYEGNTIYDGFGTNSRRSVISPSDLDQQSNIATVRLRSSTSAYWLNGDVLMPEEAVNISWSSSPMIGGMLYDNTRFAGRISSLIISPLTDDGTRSLIEAQARSLHP